MSNPEVDWVLAQLASVVTDVGNNYTARNGDPVTVKRVDRDESDVLEDGVRDLENELQQGCYLGATLADVVSDPIGTEYDHAREAVVGLRVVGLHNSEWGHVDEDGTDGVPWRNGSDGLVDRVRTALLSERTWPDAGGANVSYTDLQFTNESPQSSNYQDFYRWDVDVVFDGFETLP